MSSKAETYYSVYVGLGEDRSLAKLAQATGKSVSYMEKLSKKHGWAEQIKQESTAIAENVKKQYQERVMMQTEARTSLAERIQKRTDDNIDSIPINSARDLHLLLQMKQLLEGKPTTISSDLTTIEVDNLTDEQVKAITDALPVSNKDSQNIAAN